MMKNLTNFLKRFFPVYFLLIFEPVTARAQSDVDADSVKYQLEPVSITADRLREYARTLPYALDFIEVNEQQRSEPGISLSEITRELPGVVVHNRHNLSQGDRLTIRGMGARANFGIRGSKLLLDGIPLTTADGQSQLNNVDFATIGRVEVLRGPGSALFGNAAGGVIRLHTKNFPEHTLRIDPGVLVGADGLQRLDANVAFKLGDNHSYFSVNSFSTDGFREHAAARSTAFNFLNKTNISDHLSLRVLWNSYDAPYLLNPSSLSKADAASRPWHARTAIKAQGAMKAVSQHQTGVGLDWSFNPESNWQNTVYGILRALDNAIPGRVIELDREAFGLRSTLSHRFKMTQRRMQLRVGVDFEQQQDGRIEHENLGVPEHRVGHISGDDLWPAIGKGQLLLNQTEDVRTWGAFQELSAQVNNSMWLHVATRFDKFDFKAKDDAEQQPLGKRSMQQFSPMFGLTFMPEPDLRFYSNFSTAFQTPTANELSNREDGLPGFNADLQPEQVRSVELGSDLFLLNGRLRTQVAVYAMQIFDMLISYQSEQIGSEEIYYRNAGEARNKGVEFSISNTFSDQLSATISANLSDLVFEDYLLQTNDELVQLAGNRVPAVPNRQFFAGVNYQAAFGFFANAFARYTGEMWGNDFNGPAPGASGSTDNFKNEDYFSMDLRIGQRATWADVTVKCYLGVNNLFGSRYNESIVANAFGSRFFEPAPGRVFYFGVNVPVVK